jgi:hypothetical protein
LNCRSFAKSDKANEELVAKGATSQQTNDSRWNILENARYVFLEVTNNCNFRCNFCPLAISERPPEHMDTELAKHIIQQLHESRYRNILCFHLLGEPLLHSDIHEILRFAQERSYRTLLLTNGSLLTRDNIKSLFDGCLGEIVISMQLIDEQTFPLRGSSISWNQYLSRIRQAVNYKLTHNTVTPLRISVGVRKEDSAYPQDDYFPRISPSHLGKNILNLFSQIPALSSHKLREKLGAMKVPLTGRLDLAPGLSVSIKQMGNWRRIYTDHKIEKGSCPHFGREFGILSNGRLVHCHLDYDGKTAFADARKEQLQDVFKRSELQIATERYLKEGKVPAGCQHCIVPTKRGHRR